MQAPVVEPAAMSGMGDQTVSGATATRETRDTRPIERQRATPTAKEPHTAAGHPVTELRARPTAPLVGQPAAPPAQVLPQERLAAAQDVAEVGADPGDPQAQGPAPAALALRTTIAGRYTLFEIAERTDSAVVYAAADWGRCWQCGMPRTHEQEDFCSHCGGDFHAG